MFKLKISIEKLGYQYSVSKYFKTLLFYTIIIFTLSLVHKLQPLIASLLVLTIILLLPFIVYAQFKYMYEFQRFNDYCLYLKQMRIQYKTHKKIIVALQMTAKSYNNQSPMLSCINNTITAIENGVLFDEALQEIESKYCNSYIRKLHSYMILGEQIGGDHVYSALDNVHFDAWQGDVISFQKQKNTVKKTNIYFSLLSLAISLFCLYFFPTELMNNIFNQINFQIITFVYFEIMLISYTIVTCGLTNSWINEKE